MAILHVTAAQPGSLYLNGVPVGVATHSPLRAEIPPGGAHLLYAPHTADYLPIARFFPALQPPQSAHFSGLRALLWPGGAVEIHLVPACSARPLTLASAPFMGGTATLLRAGEQILLDVQGQLLPVGQGGNGGLRALENGLLAAFTAGGEGESLLLISPAMDAEGPRLTLRTQGEQVLLSPEGNRVRVQEPPLPGALHRVVRDYLYGGSGYSLENEQISRTGGTADTPAALVRAMAAAVLMGALDDALSMLTPSLRSVVEPGKLRAFFGPFDGYTAARHTPTVPGVEMLALLVPEGDVHIARVLAFEVVSAQDGLAIDNIRAWSAEGEH